MSCLTKLNFQTHGSLGNGTSDLFRLLSVVGAYEYARGDHKFCADHFVRPKVSCIASGKRVMLLIILSGHGRDPQAQNTN